jgi:hypothetical protein
MLATALPTITGLCSGRRRTPVASRILDVHEAKNPEQDEWIEPIDVTRQGDAAVVRVRVDGTRTIHHDHVFSRPERGEAVPFRRRSHLSDDGGVGASSDAECVETEPHPEMMSADDRCVE